MGFPNAKAGIDKIYKYEIVEIIVAVLSIITLILGTATVAGMASVDSGDESSLGAAVGLGLVSLIFALAILVLSIVGLVLLFKGLSLAGKDEPKYFKPALFIAIVTFAAQILKGFSASVPLIGQFSLLLDAVQQFGTLLLFICIVFGVRTIAEKLGKQDVVSMSKTVMILELILLIVSAAASFMTSLSAVLGTVAAVITLVSYIVYLVFLGKARKMFD
ncbi:MAG: hypothetical protein J6N15_10800 [Ruminiclostridium sp.]|nr:hypothetical protein [Ruminiclostridium sp.]